MPWHVETDHEGCDGFAVVKDADGEVEGCHETRESANRQLAALYANEPGTRRADLAERAQMTAARINDLPDSAFAYIEPGGSKDEQGKTVPRSKRHFPIHDAAHVRNALARAPQSPFGDKAMPKIRAAAKKFGIQVADERSQASSVEVLERRDSLVLSDEVNFGQRMIDVIAVPYEQEAEVPWRGETWREVFSRSAFNGIEDHAGRIPVNREHVVGDTVGRVVRLDPYDQRGLLASVKIARTSRGDDTLQLASEGMLGASIGYFTKRGSDVELNRRSMLRRVIRAFLHHLAMTDSPVFVGAETVAVREGLLAPPDAREPLVTPSLDEFMADEVFVWAKNHKNRD